MPYPQHLAMTRFRMTQQEPWPQAEPQRAASGQTEEATDDEARSRAAEAEVDTEAEAETEAEVERQAEEEAEAETEAEVERQADDYAEARQCYTMWDEQAPARA